MKWLLVFFLLNIHTGYMNKDQTPPQLVSGPYETEQECTENQTQQPPTRPENDEIKVYQCIMVDTTNTTEEL